jgi:hypothetical protein
MPFEICQRFRGAISEGRVLETRGMKGGGENAEEVRYSAKLKCAGVPNLLQIANSEMLGTCETLLILR